MSVETPEAIAERISALIWLAPEQTLITSTCGMNHLPRQIAFGELKAMAGAKKILAE
jgi:5-methyltetrahydropteroyltriglutamate--homocysteine methyltransferase